MMDDQNPFGLLYPRWQYPNEAGGTDEAGKLWTPFITLEHPRADAWIATTVAGVLDDNDLRRSRETFVFDDASSRRPYRAVAAHPPCAAVVHEQELRGPDGEHSGWGA
jgi:hypothetical protein